MPGLMAPAISAAPRVGAKRAFSVEPLAQQKPAASAAAVALASQESDSLGAMVGPRGLIGGLSAALAVRAVTRKRSRSQWTARLADAGQKINLCKTPKETYEALVEKGAGNTEMSLLKTLFASIFGGFYVGMAGLLSIAIAGNLGDATHLVSMSAQKFVFAALFPVNLLLVLQSGAQLFTGNTAVMTMAFHEGKATLGQVLKSWGVSWIGNVIGCGTMALMANYCHLLVGGTADLAIATVLKKCSMTWGPTIVKAIMCNWLVCMAVYLCTQANDLTGKMVGIWFPISMFVAIGFEHSVANMFLLPAGILSGVDLTPMQVITKNLIPVSIGNAIAGAGVIGTGFAFSAGSLGKGDKGSFSGWLRMLTGKSKKAAEDKEPAPA